MTTIKKGLGESCEFAGYHPFVNLLFYAFATGIAMFSTRPLFICIGFVCSWGYSVLLGGIGKLKQNVLLMVPVIVIMVVINTLFTHDGETVLFYLNGNRITLEAVFYGAAAAFVLTSVIVWFSSFNIIMSSDKFIYLFGRAAPVLGLTLSMIFRFIPLLKSRFAEISMGQKCMGRRQQRGFIRKTRLILKEVSILISWSLEASVETADSMEARGYGLKGRSSFHLFKFTKRDLRALAAIVITGGISAAGCIMGKTTMYYYPVIKAGEFDIMTVLTAAAYALLLAIPFAIDVRGEMKWKQLNLQM